MALRNVALRPTTIFRNGLDSEEKRPHKVCSVWPESLVRPHEAFGTHATIPGRPGKNEPPQKGAKNNRYGFLVCPAGVDREDLGECRTLSIVAISPKRVAMDLIGLSVEHADEIPGPDGRATPIVAPAVTTSELYERGFFVPEGDDPTDEELDAAEARRDAYMFSQIQKADRTWNATGKLDRIMPEAILSVRFLGEDRAWAPKLSGASRAPQVKEVECPCCTSNVKYGVKKCLNCNELLGYDERGAIFFYNDPARKQAGQTSAPAPVAAPTIFPQEPEPQEPDDEIEGELAAIRKRRETGEAAQR